MTVATYPKPEGHATACRCEECRKFVAGLRAECALCKGLFLHEEVVYREGDHGYTCLCEPCCKKPEAQCFLPYFERLARGLVSDEEIANWNAFHDM